MLPEAIGLLMPLALGVVMPAAALAGADDDEPPAAAVDPPQAERLSAETAASAARPTTAGVRWVVFMASLLFEVGMPSKVACTCSSERLRGRIGPASRRSVQPSSERRVKALRTAFPPPSLLK
ncbi:hypothetical protein SAT01_33390 [Sinomonas atrocyanea]|nr:hypothetical protein SAT01_33390 [Sinomonas atrocyanea]GGG74825.1 hypothetical protein GCM10007172_29470 [Sinomonas atrocyanea]